jgi:hypothetical protein
MLLKQQPNRPGKRIYKQNHRGVWFYFYKQIASLVSYVIQIDKVLFTPLKFRPIPVHLIDPYDSHGIDSDSHVMDSDSRIMDSDYYGMDADSRGMDADLKRLVTAGAE